MPVEVPVTTTSPTVLDLLSVMKHSSAQAERAQRKPVFPVDESGSIEFRAATR